MTTGSNDGWWRLDRETETDGEWGRVGKPDRKANEGECRERVMAESEGERVYKERMSE